MPVNQLPSPCWTADGTWEGRHFSGQIDSRWKVLPEPCFVAECDGKPGVPCGEPMGNDEFAFTHFSTFEEARFAAPSEEWQISPDGVVQCPDDRAEGGSDD